MGILGGVLVVSGALVVNCHTGPLEVAWLSDARWSRSWRTTSRRMARFTFRKRWCPTWVELKRSVGREHRDSPCRKQPVIHARAAIDEGVKHDARAVEEGDPVYR